MNAPAAHRIGHPQPLAFHLGSALAGYQLAIAAAHAPERPNVPWHQGFPGPPSADPVQVARDAISRLRQVEAGISAWQTNSYTRKVSEPPVIWSSGSTRLLDYAPDKPDAPPVLVVPSLINRAYILDLEPEYSLLRFLAERGFRPVLIDWGAPGFEEVHFDLDKYVAARLFPAAAFLNGLSSHPSAVVGYCMGGTLAVALANRMQTRAVATIGAPWRFDSDLGFSGQLRGAARQISAEKLFVQIDALCQAFSIVPDWVIQQLFALVKPFDAARKFRKFSQMDPQSSATKKFVVLEDWLADGVGMSGPAAKNLLIDWQVNDQVRHGQWHVMGRPFRAQETNCPALIIAGQKDTIARPEMAVPLADAIPNARLIEPALGHVGMIVGSKAKTLVWDPLVQFLHAAIET